jgi:FtsZ-binding cell division protein ZapB
MTKHLSKLEIKEASSVETFTDLQQSSSTEFDLAKQNISNLKKDAFETAECLASINNTIKEHLARMEKIKKLDFNF